MTRSKKRKKRKKVEKETRADTLDNKEFLSSGIKAQENLVAFSFWQTGGKTGGRKLDLWLPAQSNRSARGAVPAGEADAEATRSL